MALHGLDAQRNALKCLCPAAACDLKCAGRAQCCADAGANPSKLGPTRRVLLNQANRRICPPTSHGAGAWREGHARRSAMERINARLNDGFHFESHAIRGKARMTAPKAHESGSRSLTQPQIQANPPRKHPRTTSTPSKKAYRASVSARP